MRTRERFVPGQPAPVKRDRSVRTSLVIADPGRTPEEWPNGSGLYRAGTASFKNDKGLLGRIVSAPDFTLFKAWRYQGAGRYLYLGQFSSWNAARMKITG